MKVVLGTGAEDDEIVRQIIGEQDRNGDGQISFPEFKDMMMKIYAK